MKITIEDTGAAVQEAPKPGPQDSAAIDAGAPPLWLVEAVGQAQAPWAGPTSAPTDGGSAPSY